MKDDKNFEAYKIRVKHEREDALEYLNEIGDEIPYYIYSQLYDMVCAIGWEAPKNDG